MKSMLIAAIFLAVSTTPHALVVNGKQGFVIKQGGSDENAMSGATPSQGFDRDAAAAEIADSLALLKRHQSAGEKLTTQTVCAPRVEVRGAEDLQRLAMGVYYQQPEIRPDSIAADGVARLSYENVQAQKLRYSAAEKGWLIDNPGNSGDHKAILWSATDAACPSQTAGWQVFKGNDANGVSVWTTATERNASGKGIVEVLPLTVSACPQTLTATGESNVETRNPNAANKVGGTFTRKHSVTGATHRGRPIYENSDGMELYYWGPDESWLVGPNSSEGVGVAKATGSAECPRDDQAWFAYDASLKAWTYDYSLHFAAAV